MPPVLVSTLAVACLDHSIMHALLSSTPQPDFVLNLHSGASLTAKALRMSIDEQVPVGGMGDLSSALSLFLVREYVDPETQFRERGLRQHRRIAGFYRLDGHKYRIERYNLSPLTVIFIYDYELAAEAIRQAYLEYGTFDIVVASNPNAQITSNATDVANQLGLEVHKWGSFLSRLNYEHRKK